MRKFRLLLVMSLFILSTCTYVYGSTSLVTLYKSPQQIIATTGSIDTFIERITREGYIRIKLTATDITAFELHVKQDSIDADYGKLYYKDVWTKSGGLYVWEGHAPVVEGDVSVSIRMMSAVMYDVKLQWSEFENGKGYKFDKKSVQLLPDENEALTITRDVSSDKYNGGVVVSSSNDNIVRITKSVKNKIRVKAVSKGKATITAVLDNKQILKCNVVVNDNIYKCNKASSVEFNDNWQCEAYVTRARFTSKGKIKLTMQLNNYWMNRGYGWSGRVVGLDANQNVIVNISVNKEFYAKYGSTKFTVKVPKKHIKLRNVNLSKSTFTSIGKVISY